MRKRVLIADDDRELLEAVAATLEAAGYAISRAADGAELIEATANASFDLIVTDISMPWMSGLQASHSARYAGLATPILVITALRDETIESRVEALGVRARLLRKPFTLEDLEAAVHSLLADAGAEPASAPP